MGKKTKNNHYLSQCISKNFIVKESEPFWEYDFGRNMGPQVKGVGRLFAGRRLWSQELEDTIGAQMENQLSRIIERLVTEPVKRYRSIGKTGINELQFNGYVIESEEERKILSKLILQTFLMQRNHAREKDKNSDGILKEFFEQTDFSDKMNMFLLEIHPIWPHPPLILTDGMLFFFLVPETANGRKSDRDSKNHKDSKNKEESVGHLCFMFPISTDRFLIWGNKADADYFVMHFQNIDYLNLCRIEQQGKKCKVATQDKAYLESLIKRAPGFDSGERLARITVERGGSK